MVNVINKPTLYAYRFAEIDKVYDIIHTKSLNGNLVIFYPEFDDVLSEHETITAYKNGESSNINAQKIPYKQYEELLILLNSNELLDYDAKCPSNSVV